MEPGQRREIVGALREQGHSLRAIAGAVGASEPTVRRDLAGASHDAPDEVLGKDGKSYPARKPTVVAAKTAREADKAQTALAQVQDIARGRCRPLSGDVVFGARSGAASAQTDRPRGTGVVAPMRQAPYPVPAASFAPPGVPNPTRRTP